MTFGPERASLAGRVAVVTGGSVGIGAAIARAFAAFGADVAVCDRDAENLAATIAAVEANGVRAMSRVLDVRDGEAVAGFMGGVQQTFGAVDILVNNAGGGFHSPFMDIRARGQSALVDENFTSVTHFIRACVPMMPPKGGSIINLTSIEAFRGAPGFSVYAAMKAAVEQLSRSLALELADHRIRVNCIAPDAIRTPGDAALAGRIHAGASDDYGSKIPLGLGTADDCAAAAVFLAGDLSSFVTGSTIHVDGGSNAASGWRRRPNGHWEP